MFASDDARSLVIEESDSCKVDKVALFVQMAAGEARGRARTAGIAMWGKLPKDRITRKEIIRSCSAHCGVKLERRDCGAV